MPNNAVVTGAHRRRRDGIGACGSCPSSTMTMKMGIERRLMEKIPEIVAVEPIADEETGLELNEENIEKVTFHTRNFFILIACLGL